MVQTEKQLRHRILSDIGKYWEIAHKKAGFVPGETVISYAARVYDAQDMMNMADSLLDFWLTLGPYNEMFEAEFSKVSGLKNTVVTNSGSSANLLAISALKKFFKIPDGSHAITIASTFPTTFNPIIQNNMVPTVIDVELGTYNIDTSHLADALDEKTRMMVVPHVLGNPADLDILKEFAQKNELILFEDCCDALDSRYRGKKAGTFGDMASYSFYPAHHMTMGEGGACALDNDGLARIVRSLRDWGRDCFCSHDTKSPLGACGNRFGHRIDGIECDHRYVYSNIGYNLKPLDLQCALGISQLKKLEDFKKARERNFKMLYEGFEQFSEHFILPQKTEKSQPNWFAFPLTVDSSMFSRKQYATHLEKNKIMTRSLFAGNILRHPGYKDVKAKIASTMENTDRIMRDSFFIGCYPEITDEMINYIVEKTRDFIRSKT